MRMGCWEKKLCISAAADIVNALQGCNLKRRPKLSAGHSYHMGTASFSLTLIHSKQKRLVPSSCTSRRHVPTGRARRIRCSGSGHRFIPVLAARACRQHQPCAATHSINLRGPSSETKSSEKVHHIHNEELRRSSLHPLRSCSGCRSLIVQIVQHSRLAHGPCFPESHFA